MDVKGQMSFVNLLIVVVTVFVYYGGGLDKMVSDALETRIATFGDPAGWDSMTQMQVMTMRLIPVVFPLAIVLTALLYAISPYIYGQGGGNNYGGPQY